MCWSLEVSVLTGIFSYSVAAYIWMRNIGNDRWHSILLFTFSSIQWTDAIIWYFDKNRNLQSPIVHLVSHYITPLILSLEPLAALYGAYYVGNKIDNIDIMLYIAFFFINFKKMVTNAPNGNVVKKEGIIYSQYEDHYLVYWVFFGLLVYPFVKYTNFDSYYLIMSSVIGFVLLLAQQNKIAIGSHWCLYANILSIFLLFYPYLVGVA